jgi:GTP cyclohydrolase II
VHRTPGTDPDHAVVRLHSACITGEVLGSAKCDCGPQLDAALEAIARADWGVLVYLLRHEGRGIGLVNKIRAYALQDEGLDTVAANFALGFGADDRDFTPAVQALELLGVTRVALLTNNPAKAAVLRAAGVDVVKRVPMEVPINEHNRGYLSTKRRFFGHLPMRDPVTELLTPEAAAEQFHAEVEGARERGAGLGAIVVRIDSYAPVHEAHGHDAAEKLVARAAAVVRSRAASSTIARPSDDRFVWLVPDADARAVAADVLAALRDLRLDDEVPVTASIGVAARAAGEPLDGVIEQAAEAAEAASREGGDRLVVG